MRGVVMETQRLTIGPLIKSRRLELGLTQEELSRQSGVPQPYLSKIENWSLEGPPKQDALNRLAKTLRIPLEEILIACGYDLKRPDDDWREEDPSLTIWTAEGEAMTPEERRHYVRLVRVARGVRVAALTHYSTRPIVRASCQSCDVVGKAGKKIGRNCVAGPPSCVT